MPLFNDLIKTALRILSLYVAFFLCRIFFYWYNIGDLGAIATDDIGRVIRGGLRFDSASIFYINLPFLVFALLPHPFKQHKVYRVFLWGLFLVVNSVGLVVNISDIFYYPFKLARIASDDLHFFSEDGIGSVLGRSILDYWSGLLFFLLLFGWLWWVLKLTEKITPTPFRRVGSYIAYLFIIAATGGLSILLIRGSASREAFPMQMSDASFFAPPRQTSLVLSNPFCLIRTMKKRVDFPSYLDEAEMNLLFRPLRQPCDSAAIRLAGKPNVVLIILESFGNGHSALLSDGDGTGGNNHMPFLDSLAREGYLFTNAFQNGIRSMDALPSVWASIPSFKKEFLALPHSVAPFKGLPTCLHEMDYYTAFFHGSVRHSMSFVAFGELNGMKNFFTMEDYEAARGKGDYNGYWGIHDHKFLDFMGEKLTTFPAPFFATLFTLSSHHPFVLPEEYSALLEEGSLPIHKVIKYSDLSLRLFFEKVKNEAWYNNTLFVITADHGSRGEAEKYQSSPYNFAVPILLYHPSGLLKGQDNGIAQHIDIMPTLLNLLGYEQPFFGFGNDLLNVPGDERFAVHYFGNNYNILTTGRLYLFNEREITGIFDYKNDPLQKHNLQLSGEAIAPQLLEKVKAFLQQYGTHLSQRAYLPD